MRTRPKPQGKAMYVASNLDRDWLLSEQRKLYARSREKPDYVFCKLWGLITDPRNLRMALSRVARNMGRRTAGVDGKTVWDIVKEGPDEWLRQLREELRTNSYRPSPVRRVLIPKVSSPGSFRPLGIPTVRDRVVQAALKNILEPIFEAGFYPCSYGFRPGKSVHEVMENLKSLLRPSDGTTDPARRLPYQYVIEGDIKGCFDNIDHHQLMTRFRQRVQEAKVGRLIRAFLKAGIVSEGQLLRSDIGTPQGGILSPLLANIALSAIEERYERHAWPWRKPTLLTEAGAISKRAGATRTNDRNRGRFVIYPVRYADDFLLLISAPYGPNREERAREVAVQERAALAAFLKDTMHLELSETKTLITPVTAPIRFLGHHVRVRKHPTHRRMVSAVVVPRERSQKLRSTIKDMFRRKTLRDGLDGRLRRLNPILRGWANFYRHAWGAKRVFSCLDHYVWWTIWRWLQKKHPHESKRRLAGRYGRRHPGCRSIHWGMDNITCHRMTPTRVRRFWLGGLRPPDFVTHPGEPGA